MIIADAYKEYSYIKEERFVKSAVRDIIKSSVRGWDTETYNKVWKHQKAALDPLMGAKTRLSQWALPDGRVYIFDLMHVKPDFHGLLFPSKALTIGQNIKFDIKFATHWWNVLDFGPLFCTMTAAQVLAEGEVTGGARFGLGYLVAEYLHDMMDKTEQTSNWADEELREEQLEYAAQDAFDVIRLWDVQRKLLLKRGLVRTAEIEFDIIPAVATMELNGFELNEEQWRKQYEINKLEVDKLEEQLWAELGNHDAVIRGSKGKGGKKLGLSVPLFKEGIQTVQLGSRDRVVEAMRAKGIPIPLDNDGKISMKGPKLKALEDEWPIIKIYNKFKKLDKKLSSFGLSWFAHINPVTGRIHANYKQIGAETGRFSCSFPNLQQIPKDDLYRNCFKARDGWVFIDADYSQMELRILAEYCRDKNLLRAYDEKLDLHQDTAHYLYEVPYEEVTSDQRHVSKNQNFRIVYGGGPPGLAEAVGISLDLAKQIVDKYLNEVYPGMNTWLVKQAANTIYYLRARTMTGRARKYYGDLTDTKVKGQIERNGKNLPIQGTSVDITKRAMYFVHDKIKGHPEIKMVHVVHDEIILEATPRFAQVAARTLHWCMMKAEQEYLRRVPSAVDVSCSLIWTKEVGPEQKAEAERLIGGPLRIN